MSAICGLPWPEYSFLRYRSAFGRISRASFPMGGTALGGAWTARRWFPCSKIQCRTHITFSQVPVQSSAEAFHNIYRFSWLSWVIKTRGICVCWGLVYRKVLGQCIITISHTMLFSRRKISGNSWRSFLIRPVVAIRLSSGLCIGHLRQWIKNSCCHWLLLGTYIISLLLWMLFFFVQTLTHKLQRVMNHIAWCKKCPFKLASWIKSCRR